jgi:molybdopterin converting factor small subunit
VRTTARVLLFATAREAVGASRILRPVPPDGTGLEEFLDALVALHPKLRPILRHSRIVRNGEILAAHHGRVSVGDEIAIYPPYSGG